MRFFLTFLLFIAASAAICSPSDSLKLKKGTGLVIKGDAFLPSLLYFGKSNERYYSFYLEKLFCKRNSLQVNYANYHMRYAILKWHMIALDYKYFVSRKKNYNGYYFGGSVTQTSQYSKGGFVAPQSLQDSTYYGVYKNTSVGFGFINGVQFYLFKTLTIDILAGLVYRIVIKEVDYNPQYMWQFQKNSPTGIGPDVDLRLGVNLGFRF